MQSATASRLHGTALASSTKEPTSLSVLSVVDLLGPTKDGRLVLLEPLLHHLSRESLGLRANPSPKGGDTL